MTDLLDQAQEAQLFKELIARVGTAQAWSDWLSRYYREALGALMRGNAEEEITVVIRWARAVDGMATLLQRLADHPPSNDNAISYMIFAWTGGRIQARSGEVDDLPQVVAHLRWFAAGRPFVNRGDLRAHLGALDQSKGAKCILVVEGDKRSGKSFTLSLAAGCLNPQKLVPPIDLDQYARFSSEIDARELAVEVAGTEDGLPRYDNTKEHEAVPRLVRWIASKVNSAEIRWIMIDHCDRKALTEGARFLLLSLAEAIWKGMLPNIRLILVDFKRDDLPREWRDDVRHDHAELPDKNRVREWCLDLAAAARRVHTPHLADQWSSEVFHNLDQHAREDGDWHIEFQRRLRVARDSIMSCPVQP